MAQLTLPIRGRVVEIDVPAPLRTAIARDTVIQTGFARRTGHKITSPRGFARAIAQRWIVASEDPPELERRHATLRAHIETADDMATDSEAIPLDDLCERLFLGQKADGSPFTGETWQRLERSPWAVAGHRPRLDCETCAGLFSHDPESFLHLTDTQPVLLRILHADLLEAGALPPYSPRPVRRNPSVPDL